MIPKVVRKKAKLAELKPHPSNAKERRITPEAQSGLRASLTTFGEVQNIVVNKRSGFIVGGHERVEILISEGETDVDISEVDLGPEDEDLLRATLNNQAIAGKFTDSIGDLVERLQEDRESLLKSLRLDTLLPNEQEDIPVQHIQTGKVADRFLITVSGEMPAQADVLMKLVAALRELPGVEVGIVTNKGG